MTHTFACMCCVILFRLLFSFDFTTGHSKRFLVTSQAGPLSQDTNKASRTCSVRYCPQTWASRQPVSGPVPTNHHILPVNDSLHTSHMHSRYWCWTAGNRVVLHISLRKSRRQTKKGQSKWLVFPWLGINDPSYLQRSDTASLMA